MIDNYEKFENIDEIKNAKENFRRNKNKNWCYLLYWWNWGNRVVDEYNIVRANIFILYHSACSVSTEVRQQAKSWKTWKRYKILTVFKSTSRMCMTWRCRAAISRVWSSSYPSISDTAHSTTLSEINFKMPAESIRATSAVRQPVFS